MSLWEKCLWSAGPETHRVFTKERPLATIDWKRGLNIRLVPGRMARAAVRKVVSVCFRELSPDTRAYADRQKSQ